MIGPYHPLPPSRACACGREDIVDPRYDPPLIRPWRGPFHYCTRYIVADWILASPTFWSRRQRPPFLASHTWALEVHFRR